jgi:DNA repair exonuclease SbcCD ATPase subunit
LTIEELEEKIKKLEDIIDSMSKIPPQYYINIEKLVVNDPVLENLTFQLDKLDIKDLSGNLNLGNNFGVKTKEDKKMKEKIKKAQQVEEKLKDKKNEIKERKRSENKANKNKDKKKESEDKAKNPEQDVEKEVTPEKDK